MYLLWNQRFLFDQGCADKLKTFLKDHLIYLLAAGMGIVLAGDDHDNDQSGFIWSTLSSEIMGMLCSLCLCCALKRIDDLKAWAFHISHWLLRVKVLKPEFFQSFKSWLLSIEVSKPGFFEIVSLPSIVSVFLCCQFIDGRFRI